MKHYYQQPQDTSHPYKINAVDNPEGIKKYQKIQKIGLFLLVGPFILAGVLGAVMFFYSSGPSREVNFGIVLALILASCFSIFVAFFVAIPMIIYASVKTREIIQGEPLDFQQNNYTKVGPFYVAMNSGLQGSRRRRKKYFGH